MASSSGSTRKKIEPMELPDCKFLIVTGGTVSGLGKGTAISSLGVVLKSHGLNVTAMKIDPYLNVDAGTMSPFEHGEVFVLDDGGEADLDLGNYERFLDLSLESVHSLTSGKVYQKVLRRERAGDFLGKTVQMVPHVTDEIQAWIMEVARMPTARTGKKPDVCLIELGGTVGDIESAVYLEALQQLQFKLGPGNFLTIHLGWVPYQGTTGEQKTKPCQHSVKVMREAGLKPDLLCCRSKEAILPEIRQKLSLFCQVKPEEVISLHDVSNIFHVPILMVKQRLGDLVCEKLGLSDKISIKAPVLGGVEYQGGLDPLESRLGDWAGLAGRVDQLKRPLKIGIIGKYTGLTDSYMSVVKSLMHACIEAGVLMQIEWIESANLEGNTLTDNKEKYEESWAKLKSCAGILVPGAFGNRGIEGKILAAKYCREHKVPYFGICVGLQVATIEACRHVLNLERANSTEFDEATPHPAVVFMPEHSTTIMGGTMRLGSRCTIIKDQSSLASKIYGGEPVVYERHRHRYEVNTAYRPALEAKGFYFSGQDERGVRMEICEHQDHPFFVGVQFHPEMKSRPNRPSPVFLAFVLASDGRLEERLEQGKGKLVVGAGFQESVQSEHGRNPEDLQQEASKSSQVPPMPASAAPGSFDNDHRFICVEKASYPTSSPSRQRSSSTNEYTMPIESPATFHKSSFGSAVISPPDSPLPNRMGGVGLTPEMVEEAMLSSASASKEVDKSAGSPPLLSRKKSVENKI
ncbi:unnamed protein product [Amoebophrya sp. A120]|nr:unnamed protein product [Amoebophrya sp. A120]|eukprot:GSA120T00004143001.1